jgi:osmotically-inducible protein OsmY
MMKFLSGLAVGAAAMYVLDPVKGRSRRAVLRDRSRSAMRTRRRRADQRARDHANRELGEQARARGAGKFHPTDDRSVELHLHQLLTELDVDTSDITVEVHEGLVRVRGQVRSEDDRARVLSIIGGSRGVRSIESLLHLPDEPAPNKEPARHAGQR